VCSICNNDWLLYDEYNPGSNTNCCCRYNI
jgi:hypothetical protein